MPVLTTEAVPPSQRFGYFRDAASEHFQLQPERVGEGPFRGEVSAKAIGDLALTHIDSGGMRILRTESDIARAPTPAYPIYFVTIQVSGASSFQQASKERLLAGGDICILDPLREFKLDCERPFRQLCVKLPREWIDARLSRPDLLPGAFVRREHPLSRMLASYLINGFETAEMLTPAAGAIIAGHAVELLAQALGEARSGEGALSNAYREALFVRACRMIGLRFADPDLTSDGIARELGVSTRLLQRVFAERDKTVMRHVIEERVNRAAKLLGAPDAAHRSITDIAFSCGFNDSAHFTRAFAARLEMTPSQWRKQVQ